MMEGGRSEVTRIRSLELAIKARLGSLGWMRLLQTLPGVDLILGATIWLEIDNVQRFASAQRLAAYASLASAQRAIQWRQKLARTDMQSLQSLFEMGFCGSGQRDRSATRKMGTKISACGGIVPVSEAGPASCRARPKGR
jgi:transposase IS116/IS110/IS902 family protein